MPIPTCFENNSQNVREKWCVTGFDLVCDCQNKTFFLYRNSMTKKEKEEIKPYFDFLTTWCCSPLPKEFKDDENGVTRYYIQSGYPESTEWHEIECPPCPVFFCLTVIKAKCACCGKEMVLFDSRYHGYDAMHWDKPTEAEAEYQPNMKKITSRSKNGVLLHVKIQSILSYEEFLEKYDKDASMQDYANSFSEIRIYATGDSGRKRLIFEMKTG